MFKQKNKKVSIVVFCLLVLNVISLLAVPSLIDYQGRLTDENGAPLNGTFSITFSIYDVETLGTAIWFETLSVEANEGLFHVTLGVVDPIDENDFSGNDRWIGLKVESDDEMTPRVKIASVPYALQTENSNSIEGVNLSGIVQQDGGENVNISGTMTANSFVGDGAGLTNISGDNLGNHTATIDLNMNSHRITNLTSPNSSSDAATKLYVDDNSGDNLGDHDADQNIKLDGHWLSGDGGNEGVYVASDGLVIMNNRLNVQDDVDINGYCHVGGDFFAGSGSVTGSFTALTLNAGNAGFIRTGEPSSGYSTQDIASTDDIYADDDIFAGDNIEALYDIEAGDDLIAGDDLLVDDKLYIEDTGNGNAVQVYNSSSSYPTIHAGNSSGSTSYVTGVNATVSSSSYYGIGTNGRGYFGGGTAAFTSLESNTGSFMMTSPLTSEIEIYISGSSILRTGKTQIKFEQDMIDVISHSHPIKVIITPTDMCNGIAVTKKSIDGFIAEELSKGTSNASFDWFVIARKATSLENRIAEEMPDVVPICKKPDIETD